MKKEMLYTLFLLALMAFVLAGCKSGAQTKTSRTTVAVPIRQVPKQPVRVQTTRMAEAAQEQAARERAAQERAAQELAAQELAAQELAAQELAAQELAAQELAARELAAQKLAAQEQAAQEQAAQEQAAQEQAARELAAPAFKVGDTGPAGGIVFYVKDNNSNGWRYLEAAPAGTEQKSRGFHSAEIFSQYKTDDRRLGAGRKNTQEFIAFFEQKGGGINTPMWICDRLVVNGFDDWYLPSQDELLCMYYTLYKQEQGGFRTMWYLSSTAANGMPNNAVNFASGIDAARSGGEVAVRAVRQF
ncbi:hypothetical protein AGMMS50255_6210 [Spirochaetia bacterium]|nr:hypothetical protein AGMMS50255_6210 [Spirochaetia bacterium]